MNGVIDFDDRQKCYRKIIDRFEMLDYYSDFRSFENSTYNSLKSCSNLINKNLVSCLFFLPHTKRIEYLYQVNMTSIVLYIVIHVSFFQQQSDSYYLLINYFDIHLNQYRTRQHV